MCAFPSVGRQCVGATRTTPSAETADWRGEWSEDDLAVLIDAHVFNDSGAVLTVCLFHLCYRQKVRQTERSRERERSRDRQR